MENNLKFRRDSAAYPVPCQNCGAGESEDEAVETEDFGDAEEPKFLCEYCANILDKRSTAGVNLAACFNVLERRLLKKLGQL